MKFSANITRQFLAGTDWATARNINVLFNGFYNPDRLKYIQNKLYDMCNAKADPLRRIHNLTNTAFVLNDSKRHSLPKLYQHDNHIRDILAILFRECGFDGDLQISNKKKADAKFNEWFIEMDEGTKSPKDFEEQIKRYCNREPGRVLYIMAHEYNREDLEPARMERLREVIARRASFVPNKILFNTYSDFMKTHKIYNFKGENKTDLLAYLSHS
jgi:hypothetical protein